MIPQCAIRKLFGLVEKYANNKEERIWLNGFFSLARVEVDRLYAFKLLTFVFYIFRAFVMKNALPSYPSGSLIL